MPLPTLPTLGNEDWYAYAQALHDALDPVRDTAYIANNVGLPVHIGSDLTAHEDPIAGA